MPNFDEELAALLSLDALEPDEQADAELRLGTFPVGFSDASAALAEQCATAPPPELHDAVRRLALERRAPGRGIGAGPPCPPVEAFRRTVEDLYRLIETLSDAEWGVPAHAEHGTVCELIAHLVGVEQLSLRWLDADDDVPVLLDHVAATRPVVEALAASRPAEIAERWYRSALAVSAAATVGDPSRPVTFHDLTTSIDGFLVTRTFELWAHAMDIGLATGRGLLALDADRMRLMSSRLMAAVPLALAYRRRPVEHATIRFVLTGAGGGCYTVAVRPGDPPTEPGATIVADTTAVCRVAARRLSPAELPAVVEGDRPLAELVLGALDAFARD